MRKIVYIAICSSLTCALIALSFWNFTNEGFSTIQPIENDGEFIIYREEIIPRDDITSWIVDDDRLFVFFDDAALVNVYKTDGTFQYGIQVSSISSGIGDIAFYSGNLYILSRLSSIYIFRDDQLLNFVAPARELDIELSYRALFEAEKQHIQDGRVYEISEDKSSILVKDTMEPVVTLPQKSILAENMAVFALVFAALSMHIYTKLFAT